MVWRVIRSRWWSCIHVISVWTCIWKKKKTCLSCWVLPVWTYKYITICGTLLTRHCCQGCPSWESCYKPLWMELFAILGLCIFCLRSEPSIALSVETPPKKLKSKILLKIEKIKSKNQNKTQIGKTKKHQKRKTTTNPSIKKVKKKKKKKNKNQKTQEQKETTIMNEKVKNKQTISKKQRRRKSRKYMEKQNKQETTTEKIKKHCPKNKKQLAPSTASLFWHSCNVFGCRSSRGHWPLGDGSWTTHIYHISKLFLENEVYSYVSKKNIWTNV